MGNLFSIRRNKTSYSKRYSIKILKEDFREKEFSNQKKKIDKKLNDFRKEEGFPKTYFVYDTQEKEFSRYIIYNGDYTSKNEFYMVMLTPINAQGESWATLNAFDLCRDYQKGKLKGKLKEVAATLEEDDNRVVMLVKSKK